MKPLLLLLTSAVLLLSCGSITRYQPPIPNGVYDVKVFSVHTIDCNNDMTSIGDNVFIAHSEINPRTTDIEVGGLAGDCLMENESNYTTSYLRPCTFKDNQGNDLQFQFALTFEDRDFTGIVEVSENECIARYELTGTERE